MSSNLRLTLRTLLAYLDDTLEPAHAKTIGAKVVESEQAQELMERIKQVTRRRRLTVPTASGPGGIDPNTIAEYLDSETTSEQAAEVEQICLSSDLHLAEVAGCHQILTLVHGEPIAIPPTSKQRMYALVKGPEAIPFRKPPGAAASDADDNDLSSELLPVGDETLRMGMPAISGKDQWRNRLLVLAGTVAASLLLALALWQIMQPNSQNARPIAQNPVDSKPEEQKPADVDPPKKTPEPPPEEKKAPEVKTPEAKVPENPETKTPEIKQPVVKQPEVKHPAPSPIALPDFPPLAPPSTRVAAIGRYTAGTAKEPTVLLQYLSKNGTWNRFGNKNLEVETATPLVALPGSRSEIKLSKGVLLTLWGNLPEALPVPVAESAVEILHNDQLHADLVLRRGRIVLTTLNGEKPTMVRVRFENPRTGGEEVIDVTLLNRDSSVLVERFSEFPFGEPFYADAKNRNRQGPSTKVNVVVLSGAASITNASVTHTLGAPPAAFAMTWNSGKGMDPPVQENALPDVYKPNPPLIKGTDPKLRDASQQAYLNLARNLDSKAPDVAFAEALKSDDPAARRLAVRSYAAVDDLAALVDIIDDETAPPEVRQVSHAVLRGWIAHQREGDYLLLDKLRNRYKQVASLKIMELLHYLPPQRIGEPATYETLIDDLDNSILPIRELSAWHLYTLVPAGRSIRYSATDPASARAAAQREWFRIVPKGQLPSAKTK